MSVPRSTYRLQFREHLDFAGAARLMPYLARLGVSHIYAAPLQAARAGSTHGYDGIDFGRIEPAIGGPEGFRAFAEAMRQAGLRLLLDIVPNHMGVTPANGWWRDVLEWGAASRYAAHFDIDWSAPKLLLPILGTAYAEALQAGELHLAFDAAEGRFTLSYYDAVLPLTPPSYAHILGRSDAPALQALARRFALCAPETATDLMHDLARAVCKDVTACATAIAADRGRLHAVLDLQPWRLLHWRNARERLTYRRFFEVSELVGVRVENPRVFQDVHSLILDLVRDGLVDGLRIDHVDGLADPLDYLQRLRAAVADPDFPLVVEKILGADEVLREDWPVAGTTGYEFIASLGQLLTDESKAAACDAAYAGAIGSALDYARMSQEVKRRLLRHNLASELDLLTRALAGLAEAGAATRDLGPDTLRDAIVELAVGFTVYRTYVDANGAGEADRVVLQAALETARAGRRVEAAEALDFLVSVLTLQVAPGLQARALRFAFRFQQTTGPLMAKAVEDTLFYRFNRLIALNEVGGEPARAGGGVAPFHAGMALRRVSQPAGLSATATHDTKRGEDARARLYTLSEMPEAWAMAVRRWPGLHARGHVPEPETVWFFYQSLLGAWPLDLQGPEFAGLEELRARMLRLMQKAVREAKVHTTWTHPNEDYEAAVTAFVTSALDACRSRAFLEDFAAFAAPVMVAGAVNSLTQLLAKLVAPGVPDIYQGSELWDLSLVDPDNRSAVDFAWRAVLAGEVPSRAPADLVADWRSGALKMRVMMAGLHLRRDLDGWEQAAYLPALAHGARAHHVVSFARVLDHASVLAVGVRLPLTLLAGAALPLVPAERWGDTRLAPPEDLAGVPLFDVVTGDKLILPREGMPVADILGRLPVALLSTVAP